jgi:glycosyltransferase involved in cell wall biosynthesis
MNRAVDLMLIGAASDDEPNYEDELRNLVIGLGLQDRVQFCGNLETVLPQVRDSLALVCPSHEEPLGRVIFEAWDAGVIPVAWKESGGPAEIIEASGGGLMYEEQTGESLGSQMLRAMEMDPEERRAMVERGRAWLRENCDPVRYAERMISHWDDLVSERLP